MYSQDPHTPPTYCQIAFSPQISRPSDFQLPTSILQPLSSTKHTEMSQMSPSLPQLPTPFNPPKITVPPSSPNIAANQLPQIERNPKVTTTRTVSMTPSPIPSGRPRPLPAPLWPGAGPEAGGDLGPLTRTRHPPFSPAGPLATPQGARPSAGSWGDRGVRTGRGDLSPPTRSSPPNPSYLSLQAPVHSTRPHGFRSRSSRTLVKPRVT